MKSAVELRKAIRASALALNLKHVKIYEDFDDGMQVVEITHVENDMEICYLGVSNEGWSLEDALAYVDGSLRMDLMEAVNV